MKITFKGTFNTSDMKLISDFVEQQQTTDRETESAVIEFDGDVLIKVIVNRYGDIKKLHFRKVERR